MTAGRWSVQTIMLAQASNIADPEQPLDLLMEMQQATLTDCWGTSIRGAWWDHRRRPSTGWRCGLSDSVMAGALCTCAGATEPRQEGSEARDALIAIRWRAWYPHLADPSLKRMGVRGHQRDAAAVAADRNRVPDLPTHNAAEAHPEPLPRSRPGMLNTEDVRCANGNGLLHARHGHAANL